MRKEQPFSDDVRSLLHLEEPPADVRSAVIRSYWWQIFLDWLPASAQQTDWKATLETMQEVNALLADLGDDPAHHNALAAVYWTAVDALSAEYAHFLAAASEQAKRKPPAG